MKVAGWVDGKAEDDKLRADMAGLARSAGEPAVCRCDGEWIEISYRNDNRPERSVWSLVTTSDEA